MPFAKTAVLRWRMMIGRRNYIAGAAGIFRGDLGLLRALSAHDPTQPVGHDHSPIQRARARRELEGHADPDTLLSLDGV